MGDFADGIDINDIHNVTKINFVGKVIVVNKVIKALSDKFRSQLPAKRLVQQRLIQQPTLMFGSDAILFRVPALLPPQMIEGVHEVRLE